MKEIFRRIGVIALYIVGSMVIFPTLSTIILPMLNVTDATATNSYTMLISNAGTLLIIFLVTKSVLKKDLTLFSDFDFKTLKIIVGGFIFIFCVNTLTNMGIAKIISNPVNENQALAENMIKNNPVIMFISAAILAPIMEELVFRFSIVSFKPKLKVITVILSALVFGLLHVMPAVMKGDVQGMLYIIPYITMALVFGWAYVKTENIYVPILIHFLNNFVGTIRAM